MPINYDYLLESYPADLEEALDDAKAEREQLATLPGLEFIVRDLDRWPTGGVVTVGFLDGSNDLHAAVAATVQQIGDACGIRFDFGQNRDEDSFRRWTLDDVDYVADIRVSFDLPGYWSLVGMASIDNDLVPASLEAGGAPHQRSLNLGGFDRRLPDNWRRTVLHEFLHALAFTHEHQNPLSECQTEFRWDDDADYDPTNDGLGRFVADSEGRRPGIYTYLAGPPNNWDKVKVDHNLRPGPEGSTTQSTFDRDSVMLYRFDPLFYRSNPSPCAPNSEGDALSEGDIRGLQLLYPEAAGDGLARTEAARAAQAALNANADLESADASSHSGLLNRLDRLCPPSGS